MALSPDQDDLLKQNLINSFGAPAVGMPPTAGAGFDVNQSDSTVKSPPMAPPAAPATPPMGGATGSWEPEPPVASEPVKPGTPTGAPYKAFENPKVVDNHGLSSDDLAKYLEAQKSQIDAFGPEQEKAVMDDIRKRQNGIGGKIGDKLAQASDDVMQGVARAGSGQAMARRQQAKEFELNNALQESQDLQKNNMQNIAAKQGMDQMNNQSPVGKAMLATWGPLLDKLGVPKDKQAAMIPSLISTMSPELVKHEDVMAKLSAARMQKEGMMGYRQDQADQNNWTKLGDRVNALSAGSRKAIGVASINNMRADRALESIDNPKLVKSPQLITQLVQDVSGIYKGGSPDETSLKHSMYPNLTSDIARLQSYMTSQPEAGATKQLLAQIREQVLSLKNVDNRAIEKNLGINAVEFEPLIKKNPERWQRMIGAVQGIEHGPRDGADTTQAPEHPIIDSQEAYDTLPMGSTYTGPDGKTRRKG